MDFDLGSDVASKNVSYTTAIEDFSKKSSKQEFHVHALEEEMKKIEAFKRELPHCMHLLKDAIEGLKEESRRGVVEELKIMRNCVEGDGRVKASNDLMEKKNWMSSAQLFTPVSRNKDSGFHHRPRFGEEGGAFLPFKKSSGVVDGLSLAVVESENGDSEQPQQQEQNKKQRRCWSPELHKIFVDALHQLGGAQKATPKQIREVMKVDGLTNDEVKSHLQKYRIHIKRVDPARAGEAAVGN